MDTMQAAVLNIKLDYLDKQHEGRRHNGSFYNSQLSKNPKPIISENVQPSNQYTLQQIEMTKTYLNDTIGNNIYYPIPLHLQECFNPFI